MTDTHNDSNSLLGADSKRANVYTVEPKLRVVHSLEKMNQTGSMEYMQGVSVHSLVSLFFNTSACLNEWY